MLPLFRNSPRSHIEPRRLEYDSARAEAAVRTTRNGFRSPFSLMMRSSTEVAAITGFGAENGTVPPTDRYDLDLD
jgi:hypothetical protein